MDEQNDKPGGFRVTDRRRFTDAGDERGQGEDRERPVDEGPDGHPTQHDAAAEPVTFSTFVLGLSTQALMNLGEIPDPVDGRTTQDLVAAKQVIDILGILHHKTRNNLEQAETSLLDAILYDLRMRYVELVRGTKKEGA